MAELGTEDDLVVTEAMRRAVRREECRIGGHQFDVVLVHQQDAPEALICARCGATWRVVH